MDSRFCIQSSSGEGPLEVVPEYTSGDQFPSTCWGFRDPGPSLRCESACLGIGQRRLELILWINLLPPLNCNDLLPSVDQSIGTLWQVILNQAMQFAKIVTGHRGVHVMLGVVIHVPIQELEERIEVYCPAAEPEIGRFVDQTGML